MKSLRFGWLLILTAVLATVMSPLTLPAEAGSGATEDVRGTIDAVVEAAQKYPGKDLTKERRAKLREIIDPRFNFKLMAEKSLGNPWQEISVDERGQFIEVFSELLARTYLSKIETVKPGMVKIVSEKLDFPRSIVKTAVTSKGDVFPIEYRLVNQDGTWRVYDVVIENIGLVANYRNEFSGIIRKDGFAGLIKRLKDKNAAADS